MDALHYPDEAMLAHPLVETTGPEGTTEQTPFGFYHENGPNTGLSPLAGDPLRSPQRTTGPPAR
jgi:hypothetical protein